MGDDVQGLLGTAALPAGHRTSSRLATSYEPSPRRHHSYDVPAGPRRDGGGWHSAAHATGPDGTVLPVTRVPAVLGRGGRVGLRELRHAARAADPGGPHPRRHGPAGRVAQLGALAPVPVPRTARRRARGPSPPPAPDDRHRPDPGGAPDGHPGRLGGRRAVPAAAARHRRRVRDGVAGQRRGLPVLPAAPRPRRAPAARPCPARRGRRGGADLGTGVGRGAGRRGRRASRRAGELGHVPDVGDHRGDVGHPGARIRRQRSTYPICAARSRKACGGCTDARA